MTAKRREKRITDKERLDWAQTHGSNFGQDMGGLWWTDLVSDISGKYAQRFPSLRDTIDAAIRATRRQRGQKK